MFFFPGQPSAGVSTGTAFNQKGRFFPKKKAFLNSNGTPRQKKSRGKLPGRPV
jgi:hypothetical protein